jgi:hypothetical protein
MGLVGASSGLGRPVAPPAEGFPCCSTLAASCLHAGDVTGWPMRASKRPCGNEGSEKRRRSGSDWVQTRAYSTVSQKSRRGCTGEHTAAYGILTISPPHGAQ